MPTPGKTAVLHVALNPITGPWSVMRDLALAQAASGLYGSVGLGVIVSRDWPAAYTEELRQLGLPTYRASTLKTFGTAQFLWQRLQRPPLQRWIDDLMERSGAERGVIHFHNAWMSGVFLPLQRATARPVTTVSTTHGVNAMLEGKPLRRFLHRWMAARLDRHASALTSVDRGNLPLAREMFGLEPDRFTVIPNGVADDSAAGAAIWSGTGEFRFGHVGSITGRKGWRIGAEAALRLAGEGKQIRYLIAGEGPEAAEAERLSREHPEVIEYLGHVAQPRRHLFAKLHALTAMSVHEGLPMTIIEAMAVGVPVLATAVGGIPEAVADGRTGFLIPRDVEALADKLRALYASPDLWQTMTGHAREDFLRSFEIARIVDRYDEVYRRTFVRRGDPPWKGKFAMPARDPDALAGVRRKRHGL